MKKTRVHANRGYIMTVAIIIAIAAIFTGAFSYAEFTQSKSEKRVITTNGTSGIKFSSNLLVRNISPDTTVYKKIFYTSAISNSTVGEITVCNFPQGNSTDRSENEIVYDLEARLVMLGTNSSGYTKTNATASDLAVEEGQDELYVTISTYIPAGRTALNIGTNNGVDSGSQTISEVVYYPIPGKTLDDKQLYVAGSKTLAANSRIYTIEGSTATEVTGRVVIAGTVTLDKNHLSGGIANAVLPNTMSATHPYTVTFSPDFINKTNLGVYIIARPHSVSDEVQPLDAVIVPSLNVLQVKTSWYGDFNDHTTALSPEQPDYDGFNYVITGYGAGECTLEWDNSQLEISKLFIRTLDQARATDPNLTHGAITTSGTKSSITFKVDSNSINRYETQFYYASGYGIDVSAAMSAAVSAAGPDESVAPISDWDVLKSYVTLTFEETSEGSGETP